MQTKLGSFTEAWANIAVGFAINFTANMVVLPWFGFNVTAGQAFGIGIVFTVISLVRSYVLRRWFNGLKFGNVPGPTVHDNPEGALRDSLVYGTGVWRVPAAPRKPESAK